MKYLLLIPILCFGCRSLDKKIIQDSIAPNLNPANASLAMAMPAAQPEVVLPPPPFETRHLGWSYSLTMPATDTNGIIMFEVDKTDSLDNPNWFVYCYTNQSPVQFYLTNSEGYFRVSSYYQ